MSTSDTRLIDDGNGTRTKPMRVLVLGMSKTGTFCRRNVSIVHFMADANEPISYVSGFKDTRL